MYIYIHKSVIISKRFQHSILDEKLGEIIYIYIYTQSCALHVVWASMHNFSYVL